MFRQIKQRLCGWFGHKMSARYIDAKQTSTAFYQCDRCGYYEWENWKDPVEDPLTVFLEE